MPNNSRQFYEFGPFRIDVDERFLLRDGEVVPLTRKAFELLLVMVERSGHVFAKDELMQKVWPDSFVEEANLSRYVHDLREVLGDRPGEPKYIETVPRRGYRFVASVREVKDEGADLMLAERTRTHIVIEEKARGCAEAASAEAKHVLTEHRSPARMEEGNTRPKWKTRPVALLTVAGILALSGGIYLWNSSRAKTNQPARTSTTLAVRTMAVLPFKPLVVDNNRDESLELGMADTLITRLGNLQEITVRPTSAVLKYVDRQQDAVAAGRELMVDSVLDGSIQKQGDRIRVTVRLVRVSDGSQLWADKFDEKFTDIFAVQDAISERVIGALALKLTSEESTAVTKRYTESADAYQLYVKGRYFWEKRTGAALNEAINFFNQAVEKDPNYALAYTGLADAYVLLPEFGSVTKEVAIPKAKAAAVKALEIDDRLAEAHSSLGEVLEHEREWQRAGQEHRRAIELNPNYAQAHHWYADYLSEIGQLDEALAEIKEARRLNPVSLIINTKMGHYLYLNRQYDLAIEQLLKTLQMDPNFIRAHSFLRLPYVQKGMYEQAIVEYQKARVLAGTSSEEAEARRATLLRAAYSNSGERGFWQKQIELLQKESKPNYDLPWLSAEAYIHLGDKDQAFAWLQRVVDEGHPAMFWIKVDPAFDSIRSDPRYADLVRRIGLTP